MIIKTNNQEFAKFTDGDGVAPASSMTEVIDDAPSVTYSTGPSVKDYDSSKASDVRTINTNKAQTRY